MRTRQTGYSLIELSIVIVIVFIIANILLSYASDFIHRMKIDSTANDMSLVPIAVQRRNAHDGFLFSFWDENGGRAPTADTLVWDEGDGFLELLNDYLVGRSNTQCGQGADGWNPVNTDGQPDGGVETLIERAALVPCYKLRGRLPWGLTASAALSPDTTGAVGSFAMYLNFTDAYFDAKDNPDNNILNMSLFRNAIEAKMKDGVNGVPRVAFTVVNDLADITDDGVDDGAGGFRSITSRECELDLENCVLAVYIDFAGTTNGMFKRTDNQDYFVDDVTFGSSIAGGRQKCAYWTENAGGWTSTATDCGIKGGSGDTSVTLVVNSAQTEELRITEFAGGVAVDHLCRVYQADPAGSPTPVTLRPVPAPDDVTPCGFTKNGNIVQLLSDEMHTGVLYGEDVIATAIFSSQMTLYSDTASTVFIVKDTSGNPVFRLDNSGNFETRGNGIIEGDISVTNNASFLMANNSTIQLGLVSDASSLTLSRSAGGDFTISSTGPNLEILAEERLSIGAPEGVVLENGTTLHASRSTLTGELFDPDNGVNSDALKSISEMVTADMAKYLDDTSSPIQIVGIDRIEGEFATLTKPNCLAFAKDSNYTVNGPESNPYRKVLTNEQRNNDTFGQSLARLVLVPIFMKTYNAAFGDNQIYSQHGVHSSPSEWDIYLYLSGEGAFGTGGREDGAGASLAMSICDYSSLNLSRQVF